MEDKVQMSRIKSKCIFENKVEMCRIKLKYSFQNKVENNDSGTPISGLEGDSVQAANKYRPAIVSLSCYYSHRLAIVFGLLELFNL